MPGLGQKYNIKIDVFSQPKPLYQSDEYFEKDLPVAPAVVVGDEIVAEGADVSGHEIEVCICRHLGLPEPEPEKKGIVRRIFKK